MANPAEMLADLLVTAGIATKGAQTGWNVFVGKMPERPSSAISIQLTGGTAPNPRWLLDFPSVQALIRGDENAYQAAYTKAVQVKDALLGLPSQTIGTDRIVHVNGLGDIASLGFDESNRVMFSVNFAMIIEPGTSPETNRVPL